MLRLTEFALFLAPFVAFAVWRFALGGRAPSAGAVAAAVGAVALLAAALLWFAQNRALLRGAAYVPAELRNGRIVPGHTAGPAPP